jgi:GTP 3',8-cyclase
VKDRFERLISYVRLSVTDRCNLRCRYCIPQGMSFNEKDEILTYEEIARLARVFATLGVTKLRITGGEPLVRADLPALVALLAAIPGIGDLALSTNGLHLDRLAAPLARAGLKRVNVSLDSIDRDRFRDITKGGDLDAVLRGIAAAEAAGLAPIRINVVAMRGVNDDEVEALAELTRTRGWTVRFIEVMPLEGNVWEQGDRYLPAAEILERLRRVADLRPEGFEAGGGPAEYWRFPGAPGRIGVITPLSHTFCERCNRVRLTSKGGLRLCLFGDDEVDLRGPLRAGASDDDLRALIHHGLSIKPEAHALKPGLPASRLVALSQVGG